MRPSRLCAFVGGAVFLFAIPLQAALWQTSFGLDGLQETPPVATPGWGTAEVTLNTATGLLTWDVAYQDLIGVSTAAHFHGPAAVGQPAGIRVDMGGSGQFGGNSGTLIGNSTIADPAWIQEIFDGLWYINIHSTFRPGGEIRGQVDDWRLVPEPASAVLLMVGTIGAMFLRRRSPR